MKPIDSFFLIMTALIKSYTEVLKELWNRNEDEIPRDEVIYKFGVINGLGTAKELLKGLAHEVPQQED